MSNFFKIYYATPNKNETGYVSHQIEMSSVQENYDYTHSNSYRKTYFDKKINYEVIFPIFELVRGAKLTDLMNYSGGGSYSCIIISLKFLSILKKFKIDDYQTFEIKIRTSSGLKDYIMFFMYALERDQKYIDWTQTTFRIKPYMGELEKDQLIKIENYESFWKFRMELFNKPKQVEEIKLTNLELKKEIIIEDMFKFSGTSSGFFVSEALKNEIEKQDITGIRFRDADGLREPSYSPEMD